MAFELWADDEHLLSVSTQGRRHTRAFVSCSITPETNERCLRGIGEEIEL